MNSNNLTYNVLRYISGSNELDMDKHKEFIVGRVLDYGFIDDWRLIKEYYSLAGLAEIAKNIRSLMPKSLAFISTVTDTPISDYRCYKLAQSNPPHWNF